ncbi:SMP-30/gluconolactonase/LRE family protein [Variovorax sp. VNK109]|uniref:SMP-30/gluconolactonase/LRE family protein n=1 Tax=Variovorax sp. VNK109 TaxID=3400919 RepID=UPI003C0BE850
MSNWQAVVPERFGTGESPFWHPVENTLYWVDIPGQRVLRANVFMGTVESWPMPSEPGCIAPAQSGGLVIALRDGVYRARSWGGPLAVLARFNHDPRTTRFNDGKCDPLGRFWAGTIYEPRDARKGDLYSIDCRPDNGNGGKPQVALKAHNVVVANGLAWSADARTLYWTDTTHHVIQAWDWEGGLNVLKHHRVFHQFPSKPKGWTADDASGSAYGGRPDGAAVDAEGNYWVAMYEGARVLKLSPAGDVLAEIPVPVKCPTMPCFGGDDLRTLYLTTASHGRSGKELEAHPLSGRVLSMRVDVPGLPVNYFVD